MSKENGGLVFPVYRNLMNKRKPMSRATKLAVKLGMLAYADQGAASCVWTSGCNGVSQSDLEAFYHAARAEMAMEAAQRAGTLSVNGVKADHTGWIEEELRAMADREGK